MMLAAFSFGALGTPRTETDRTLVEPIRVCTVPNQPIDITIIAGPNALGNPALPIALEIRNTSDQPITNGFFDIDFPDVKDRGLTYSMGFGFDDKYGASNIQVNDPVAPGASIRVAIPDDRYSLLASYLDRVGQERSSVTRAIVMVQVIEFADGLTFLPGGYYKNDGR